MCDLNATIAELVWIIVNISQLFVPWTSSIRCYALLQKLKKRGRILGFPRCLNCSNLPNSNQQRPNPPYSHPLLENSSRILNLFHVLGNLRSSRVSRNKSVLIPNPRGISKLHPRDSQKYLLVSSNLSPRRSGWRAASSEVIFSQKSPRISISHANNWH